MTTPDEELQRERQRREVQRELDSLGELPRHLLLVTSTRLSEAAERVAADPQARVLLHLSRVLRVIGEGKTI